jgi:hypothetical protein
MSQAQGRRRSISLLGTVLIASAAAGCSGSLVFGEEELVAPDAGGGKTDDPADDGEEQTEFRLAVPVDRPWSDTGVDLDRGEMFSVLASDTIDFGSADTDPEGYEPDTYDQYNVVPCTDHAGLIGRIGQDGYPFFLGAEALAVATSGGRLYLGVNDSNVGDNSGSYAAVVTTDIANMVTDQKGVTVDATVAWTDSQIDVEGGDMLVITASGKIDDSTATPDTVWGPEGKPDSLNSQASIIGCAPHVALLGKIGANGAPFVVGASYAAPAPLTGRLYLGLNDKQLVDEGGKLAASVTLIER